MENSHSVKLAVAGGQIWHVLDDAGRQIGSCSSRQDALRIASLVCGRASVREGLRGEAPTVAEKPCSELIESAVPRPQMFEWYAPRQGVTPPSPFAAWAGRARRRASRFFKRLRVWRRSEAHTGRREVRLGGQPSEDPCATAKA